MSSSSRGTKRPRKSTQKEARAAATAAGQGLSSSSSTAPVDILKPRPPLIKSEADDSIAYSATPPVAAAPTKKLSRGNSAASLRSNKDEDDDDREYKGSVAAASRRDVKPVKSALAGSARLASGPPGAMLNDRYKRSMYIAFVDGAFAERDKGSTKSYWDLVSQFRSAHTTLTTASSSAASSNSNTQSLSLWLHALSHHVARLDSANHSQLVENILDLPWAGVSTGDDFSRSWCSFVCALVSARTEWASSVVTRIVKAMRWRSDWLPLRPLHGQPPSPTGSASSGVQPAQPSRPTRRLLYTRLHSLLRTILILIPTLPSTLAPLVIRHFPHKRESRKEQATYAHNILFMTRYCPQVAESVWRVVGDRAISLDVEIQIEMDDLEDGAGEGLEEELANLDPFDRPLDEDDDDSSSDGSSDDGGGDDDDDSESGPDIDELSSEDEAEPGDEDADGLDGGLLHEQEAERRQRKVRDLVEKLDALLKVAFEHLERISGKRRAAGTGSDGLEAVLIPRDNATWMSDFLGTGSKSTSASSTPSGTPTTERPPSSPGTARNSPTSFPLDDEEQISLRAAERHSAFQHLLHLFSRSILPTFKCRHVQFLLFWYCSLEPDFTDWFLGLLIHKAIYSSPSSADEAQGQQQGSAATTNPIVLRQAAASYVASFVSRASYVDAASTRIVVHNLCAFLEAHLEEHAAALRAVQESGGLAYVDEATARLASAPAGSEEHAIFYAVAQGVFYVFCFRWQDLRNGDGEHAKGGAKNGADKSGSLAPSDDFYDADPGFMIGSLSSTGSSSFALPSSLHQPPKPQAQAKTGTGPSPRLVPQDAPSSSFPLSPSLSATQVPPSHNTQDGSSSSSGWSPGLSNLQRCILSPLNPLHFCSPTVVYQFASVAQHVGLLYCWSVIEANRRGGAGGARGQLGNTDVQIAGRQQSGDRGARPAAPARRAPATGGASASDLEGFFPFDPYRLRGTAERFVEPLYRDWKDVAPQGLGGADDDDSSDGEDDEDGESEDDEDDEVEQESSLAPSSEASSMASSALQRATSGGLQIPGASPARRRGETSADAKFAKSMELMSVSGS